MRLPDLSWMGAVLGFSFGLGLLLMYAGLPHHRRVTLADRLHPYLRDAPRPSRLLATDQGGGTSAVAQLTRPLVEDLSGRLERLLGSSAEVRRRLVRAGRAPDVHRFRAEQVLWGALGTLGGLVAGATVWVAGGGSPVAAVLVTVCGSAAGVLLRDHWLTRQVSLRERSDAGGVPHDGRAPGLGGRRRRGSGWCS